MMTASYTGRYKYRFKKQWFSGEEICILQVEICCIDFDPLKQKNEKFVFWRDAKKFDLNQSVVWEEYVEPGDREKVVNL